MSSGDLSTEGAGFAALPEHIQVVIAGGGPVGLATAVELGRRGISCVVIEPRAVVSHLRPRCKTVNVRTMEHLRRWGIADAFREVAPIPVSWSNDVAFCTSMVGHELSRFHGVLGLVPDGDRFPEVGQQAPQYLLEELLRDTVRGLPACTLVTGASVVGVHQDSDHVRIDVEGPGGATATIAADYVVGCDGPRSVVREQIGSAYVGGQALRPNFGMVFRCPELAERTRLAPAVQYWVVNAAAPALMGPLDLEGSWWIILFGVEEADGRARGAELIHAAIGAPLPVEIISTDPWTARMQLVDRARVNRVFLAGDAAHLNPPFGGHGLNTGVGDAVDLGWKLAAVLQGWGGPGLLDTYGLERRPVQDRVIREATANMSVLSTELTDPLLDAEGTDGDDVRQRAHFRIQETKHAEFHALDLVLDVGYDSPIISRGDAHGLAGYRLAHAWLAPDHSLFDDLGPGFTLLVLRGDDDRAAPWVQSAQACGVPFKVLDLRGRDLLTRLDVDLVLVRPDQYVAWAGPHSADAASILDASRGQTSPVAHPTPPPKETPDGH